MILYTTKDVLDDSDTTTNLLWCDTKVNDVILEYGIWWHKIGKYFYPVLGLCRIGQCLPRDLAESNIQDALSLFKFIDVVHCSASSLG